jgi:hypothetical protein
VLRLFLLQGATNIYEKIKDNIQFPGCTGIYIYKSGGAGTGISDQGKE